MKMNELSINERIFLDKVNMINKKYEKDKVQCMWNVCYGYLHKMFDDTLLNRPDSEIESILNEVNLKSSKVTKLDTTSINTHTKVYKGIDFSITVDKSSVTTSTVQKPSGRKPMSEEGKRNIREGILRAKQRKLEMQKLF